jgi:cytochrome P450 family 9
MFFWFGVIAVAYLFYKWAVANNDYFEKRGVAFLKPTILLGSNFNLFFNKKSLPDTVKNWYNDSKMRKEK